MRQSKVWFAVATGVLGFVPPALCQSAPTPERLTAAQIRLSLVGKAIAYSPPGSVDAGVSEEFHEDGKWQGIAYSRGPIDFSGRWSIEANRLCVLADKGSFAEKWHTRKYCRQVWRNTRTEQLLLAHLKGTGDGRQAVSVHDLPR